MHFRGDFQRFKNGGHFIVKTGYSKNICEVVEIHKNRRNPF